MTSILRFINLLIPFATPGTPLVQDLIHLVALCALFYFGPQLQERFSRRSATTLQRPEEGEEDRRPEPQDGLQEENIRQDVHNQQDGHHIRNPQEDDAIAPAAEAPIPGPAHPRHPEIPNQRPIGAKKAKALARKDQRRAYNEFLRQQGEAQRAEEARDAAERERELAPERERRRAVEAALEARLAKEREERKRRVEEERVGEIQRREDVGRIVREEVEARGCCDLWRVAERVGGDVDGEWVEDVVRRSTNLLRRAGDAVTMATEKGWVVRVTKENMDAVYQAVVDARGGDGDGVVGYDQLAHFIEKRVCR